MCRLALRLSDIDEDKLSRRQRHVVHVFWFESDVQNSGLDQFILNGYPPTEVIEALEAIGASQSARLLRECYQLFPGGAPAAGYVERRSQISAITGGNRHLEEMVSGLAIEIDLYQRLLEYWWREAPSVPDVDLSKTGTAAELLGAVSNALGLHGEFGNSLDAFAESLVLADDLPRELVLIGWTRITELMPRDSALLLEYFSELGREYPECKVAIRCR